ncbi:hypothetical protein KAH81_00060 [bacterium]|nr:hypothetical protein [bacterium]
MSKFLTIKLIEPQAAPILVEQEEGKKKNRWIIMAIAGVFVVVLAIFAWNYLPKIIPKLAMKHYARSEQTPRIGHGSDKASNNQGETTPRIPQDQKLPVTEKPPEKPQPPKRLFPELMPWHRRTSPLIEIIRAVQGDVFSMTTGSEGVIFITGVLPMDVDIQTSSPIFRTNAVMIENIIDFNIVRGKTEYILGVNLAPVLSYSGSETPIPPYLRGAILREIDSLARSCGLSSVNTIAVGREEIAGGSRYLIGVKGIGSYNKINGFVKAIENSGKMIEISRFSLDGINDKPLIEDTIKAGFIIRAYDIKISQTTALVKNPEKTAVL